MTETIVSLKNDYATRIYFISTFIDKLLNPIDNEVLLLLLLSSFFNTHSY